MPRLAFIYRTDCHNADKGPSSWKGDYSAEIDSNLRQIGVFAKEHEANAVLDGGDFIHVKSSIKTSHGLIVRTANIHGDYPCPTFCIEGNHDMQYNNLESIETQPLGALYATRVFQRLREQVFEDGPLRARVVGVPYSPARQLADLRAIQKKPGDTFLIAIVHALAAKNPPPEVEDFFGEPVFKYEDLITKDGPDVWMFGHWHRDQGIEVIKGKQFVNLGAVSRGSLIRENLERTPKVAFIECTESKITAHPLGLEVLPASEVFDLERKEQQEAERQDINQFVSDLVSTAEVDTSLSIPENIRGLANFAKKVQDKALYYYERAEAG